MGRRLIAAEQLTERETQVLEHLHKASELKVSLAEYARSFDLDVKDLYSAKQSIAKKGLLPARVGEHDKLSDFVEVMDTPAAQPIPTSLEPVCRIRCPNGVLIECLSWPTAQWIARLAGCAHVPA